MADSRRRYTRKFKLEAARLAQQPGITLTELGIRSEMLYRWRKEVSFTTPRRVKTRLRTDAAKRFKKVVNAKAVMWRMLLIAEKRFRRLRSPHLLSEVHQGVQYVNGIRHDLVTREAAAKSRLHTY